ncbi:MAG: hypothetical protein V1750_00235 [Acidobacteriota bacterium]
MMHRGWRWWAVALIITLASVVWQRLSGPTYPVRGRVALGSAEIAYRVTRTHGGAGDQPVQLRAANAEVHGEVAWRRFPTQDAWQVLAMWRNGEWLEALLPHQPPAGKLEYQVRLRLGAASAVLPARPAVTRFKGEVSDLVLVPHIAGMFLGMLFATRAGLEALAARGDARRLGWVTLWLIALGGFVLGPAVQKAAFGAWWTGVPFGWDLTDNKTLIAGIAWVWALWRMRGGRPGRAAVLLAAVVTLVVFAIPHSVWGSQIDWQGHPALGP